MNWNAYICMYIPGGYKQRIYLQCRRFRFNPWVRKIPWRKEEMATHSSILAWRSPWTEKPGGLQPMGSHKSQTQLISWTTKFMYVVTWLCTFSPAVYNSSIYFCSLLHQHLVLSEFFIFYRFIGFKMLSWSLCIFLQEEDLFKVTGHVLNLCSFSC